MRSTRSRPSLPIALACLMLGGCTDAGRTWLLSSLGLQPCPPVVPEPVPAGARRAASRQEIVDALERARESPPPPRLIATLDEVVEACPCYVQRLRNKRIESQQLASGCASQPCSSRAPRLSAPPSCDVMLTSLTLTVEAEGEVLAVTIGSPVQCNGCVYGFVESAERVTERE